VVSVITPSYGRFDLLLACVDSVRLSSPVPTGGLEIVVVTSSYTPTELDTLRARQCTVLVLDTPASASASRNVGVSSASGQYLLFLDDDNVVATNAIWLLWHTLESQPEAAIVGPAMYFGEDRDRLWCAGVRRSRVLMRTEFRRHLPPNPPKQMASEDFPNCFMVRRTDFVTVNGFDASRFPQHYEEADLARRIVKATSGGVCAIPAARVWHFIEAPLARRLHLRSENRAYLCARGKAMFTAVYGDSVQWAAYLLVAQWAFAVFYLGAALWLPGSERMGVIRGYLRGLRAGLVEGWRARSADRLTGNDLRERRGA
jgi:GT2 family glycosyltransferase